MPELCRFSGMIIRMFFADDQEHHKPHIHIVCDGMQATVALDGELLAGSFPPKKLALIRAWLILREDELYEAWNNAVRSKPIEKKIAPLE